MREDKLIKSLIIQHFKEFYQELVLLKAEALSGDLLAPIGSEDRLKGNDVDKVQLGKSLARHILDRLYGFMINQYEYVERNGGGFAVKYYREAQYIMVALADEVFLNLNWIGRQEWEDNLLESRMFNIQVAGEKFFENLDTFLEVRDGANSDIGVLYIIALGIGFKGKYKNQDDHGILQSYRKKLYARVMYDTPYLLDEKAALFPETYKHTIDQRNIIKMPNLRGWYIALGLVGVVLLLGSGIVWSTVTHPIQTALEVLNKWATQQ